MPDAWTPALLAVVGVSVLLYGFSKTAMPVSETLAAMDAGGVGQMLISAWYGVYCVYHAGFSRMFRWITPGVTQS